MAKKQERRGLGRGLSALMADVDVQQDGNPKYGGSPKFDLSIAVEEIAPNPDQPRRDFVQQDLDELAASIREKGIIQPLIVRRKEAGSAIYEIVAGERRWRAAQLAQLHEVPAVIRDFDDSEVLEIAIIENVQRADLNAVEEALGYRQLQDRFGHTQEQLAKALGKSRSHITNLMRLLTLPDDVVAWLREGKLTAGHARALITTGNASELAKVVITKDLSVRETEKLAKNGLPTGAARTQTTRTSEKDADTRALEKDLSASLGMKVAIDHSAGKEDGRLTIKYADLSQLDDLCQRLSAMVND